MQLHIISQSPYRNQAFSNALALVTANDYILLLDDAVYAVTGNARVMIEQCAARWLVLNDDLVKRGLPTEHNGIETIDMDRFVQLSFSVKHCVSWY